MASGKLLQEIMGKLFQRVLLHSYMFKIKVSSFFPIKLNSQGKAEGGGVNQEKRANRGSHLYSLFHTSDSFSWRICQLQTGKKGAIKDKKVLLRK